MARRRVRRRYAGDGPSLPRSRLRRVIQLPAVLVKTTGRTTVRVQSRFAETRFAETRFAETLTLTLTLNLPSS